MKEKTKKRKKNIEGKRYPHLDLEGLARRMREDKRGGRREGKREEKLND